MNTDSDDAKGLAELRDLCDEGREKMIENLADVDENLADKVLAEEGEGYASISSEMIQKVCCLFEAYLLKSGMAEKGFRAQDAFSQSRP